MRACPHARVPVGSKMRGRRGWMLTGVVLAAAIGAIVLHASMARAMSEVGRVRGHLSREQTSLLVDSAVQIARGEIDAGRDPAGLTVDVPGWGRLEVRRRAAGPGGLEAVARPIGGAAVSRPVLAGP